uniref:Cytochrome c oxidase subunit 2 n=1 Tax=Afrocampsis griseosetosus TaxID=1491719 RepID=A0A0U1WEM4_9HYME|nr:cytochrome c oxidase subunit II [Afrocampsis griseosetosus]
MATWSMMNFQDSNSFIMMLMVYFHDYMMVILFMILIVIFYIILWILMNNLVNLNILHNQLFEMIWTLIPMFILLLIAMPSLKILYNIEEYLNFHMSVKVMGHQWYWSYEYSDFGGVEFDSFMINDFNLANFRLLDVDNRMILPSGLKIRGVVSSMDVIHSWTIPSLGVKVDAVPGRINQFMMMIDRSGIYFGQCSEICGLNHSFMPIVMEVIKFYSFINWVNKF